VSAPREEQSLPGHIEDAVGYVEELHAEDERSLSPLQRAIERVTGFAGRPQSLAVVLGLVAAWVAINLFLPRVRVAPLDPFPFPLLDGLLSLAAFLTTLVILITQRRESALADLRERLTLQFAIVSEQKIAKSIELLERLRRDSPGVADYDDHDASTMSRPAQPGEVVRAIEDLRSNSEPKT